MEKSKRKRISSHSPDALTRTCIFVLSLMFVGLHIFLLSNYSVSETTLVFFMVVLILVVIFDAIFMWWVIIFMAQSQVTLFEEGIELKRGRSKFFSRWDNVSHFGLKGFGRGRKRGLFLYEKVELQTQGLLERIIFGCSSDFLPIGLYILPLNIWDRASYQFYIEDLLDSEFGQLVNQYAPHLFEGEGS